MSNASVLGSDWPAVLCCQAAFVLGVACSTGLEQSGPYAGLRSSTALPAVLETPCLAVKPVKNGKSLSDCHHMENSDV